MPVCAAQLRENERRHPGPTGQPISLAHAPCFSRSWGHPFSCSLPLVCGAQSAAPFSFRSAHGATSTVEVGRRCRPATASWGGPYKPSAMPSPSSSARGVTQLTNAREGVRWEREQSAAMRRAVRAAALGTSSTTPYGLGNQAGDLRGVAVDSSGTATGESENWGTANRSPDVWRAHQITVRRGPVSAPPDCR
jgi:hypothetical protein